MSDSHIEISTDATAFVGADATALFRATALKIGLRMYAKFKMQPNRMWTPTAMLQAAGKITGKTYKRGQYEQAAADVETWANEMRAALPVVDTRGAS